MTALIYRFLTAGDLEPLYHAFLTAFSDYSVPMQSTLDQFQHRLLRDRVRLDLSAGAFDEDRIVGFFMNGYGLWEGEQTTYDAGTGVIPTYRGKKVASQLFEFMLPHLKASGARQYLLEVIGSNTPAINLYSGLGFAETRRFAVLKSERSAFQTKLTASVCIREVEETDWKIWRTFWDATPSWQNSIDAIELTRDRCKIVAAETSGQCVGYGVLSTATGNLMQMAVAPSHRSVGIGSLILSSLQEHAREPLKVTNVDLRLTHALKFLGDGGFKEVLQQIEMAKRL